MQLAVNLATAADDAAIRALLRQQPMPGRIRIAYQREPEFRLGCEVTGDDCQVLVARRENSTEVAGLACRSVRCVFINGVEQRLGYLGQLRIASNCRGRWLVARGFAQLKQLHDRDPLPAYLASIVDGNREATGVLVQKRRKNFPVFHPVADYCTLAIGITRAKRSAKPSAELSLDRGVQITAPLRDELAQVAVFLQANGAKRQFFPAWTVERIERLAALGLGLNDLRIARRGGEIVGVAGLWDQSGYKQAIVHSYTGWLKAAAPIYNLGAPWFGRAALPRPGEKLRSAYASLLCVAGDEIAVFRALLRELYNLAGERLLSHLLVGLDSRDPLLPAALEYSHILYASRLYLAEWPEGGSFYEQLDGRPFYVDIATL